MNYFKNDNLWQFMTIYENLWHFCLSAIFILVIDILSLSSASRSNDEVVDRGRILWLDNIDIPKPELSISENS